MPICRLCTRLFVCKNHDTDAPVCPDCHQFRGWFKRVIQEQKGKRNESTTKLQKQIAQRVGDAEKLESQSA